MGRKLSTMVFNDPRAKTKTVLEMKCKKDSESSRFLAVSDSWCVLSQSTRHKVIVIYIMYFKVCHTHDIWHLDVNSKRFLYEIFSEVFNVIR